MKHFLIVLSFFLALMLFHACGQYDQTGGVQITVVTSIFPIYDIVRNVAGERAAVRYVIPVGANPHHYEPFPSTVMELQRSNLFIGVHREFDGWITDLFPEKTRTEFLLSEEGEEYHTNPHIWLTPSGGKQIATVATHLLSSVDPQNRNHYQQNLTLYLKELSKLDSTFVFLFDQVSSRKFIQWHPAWDYLARDYQLIISATIEHGHGDEPSVKEFKHIIDVAKENDVRVVVIGLHAESKATEALVREINGMLLKLDSIGDPAVDARGTYIKMMHHNAILLSAALNRAAVNAGDTPQKE